jgi:Ca-activated chloride channel homolog
MTSLLAALVNGGILSALVAIAVWLALRVTPRRALNAATRYAVWWATLAVAVTLPALYLPSALSPFAARVTSRSAPQVPASETAPPIQEIVDSIEAPLPLAARSRPLFPVEIAGGRLPRWIVIAWIITTVFMLVRLILSCVLLERRKARAFDAPAPLAARLEAWLAHCGSARRRVRLAGSAEVTVPMVAGPFRPSILLPTCLLEELGETELDQIGLHEAAHLARRDDYALICQRVLEALFAFHPVVHWIARRIDLEREIACDDFVVQATGSPRPYATCLTRIVELTGGVRASLVAAAAAEERSHLAARVEMLLDKSRHTGTHLLKLRLAAIGVAMAVLVWVAARTPGMVAFAAPLGQTVKPISVAQIPPPPLAQPKPFAPPPPLMPAQESKPHVDTMLVRVAATVTDPLNRFVTGLAKNAFTLFEDSIEQEILQFSNPDSPLSIGIVMDSSAGADEKLQLSQQALAHFLKTANPQDEFFLIQFSDRPELLNGFTSNPEELQNEPKFNLSDKRALLDSIYMAMYQMKKARNPRKSLMVITRGDDNNSRYTASEIRTLLRETDIRVDAIFVSELGDSLLRGVAEQTGGRYFAVNDPVQLPDLAAKIGIELRNLYELGYRPQNTARDGKYRTVRVKVQAPGLPPLRAFFRAGYYPSTP